MDCCPSEKPPSSSCHDESSKKRDYFYLSLLILGFIFYGLGITAHFREEFIPSPYSEIGHSFFELMNVMSWGLVLGIIFVGLLALIPREYILSVIGKPRGRWSLVRATLAGVLLDLCSHGILMVGAKFYQRGASLGQTMAFLVSSPWNSFSLTLILFALIGFWWTIVFIVLSMLIALITGYIFDLLVERKVLPSNPYEVELDPNFKFWPQLKKDFKGRDWSLDDVKQVLSHGLKDSKMILKWILFGALLTAVIQTFVSAENLQQTFGPSILGLALTLIAATIIEVCSEGATPIASDLLVRAQAPGNAFTFLMAGVATDYTEILVLKETTKSWKIAFFLPLISVPQILIIGYLLNNY
jgi:uncharacterized protein